MSLSIFSMLLSNNRILLKILIFASLFFNVYATNYCDNKEEIARSKDSLNSQISIKAQVDSLNKFAFLIQHSFGKEKENFEQQFLKYFPNSFKKFNLLYGYKEISPDSVIYMPLYASDHIEKVLFNLESINDTIFYKKLINISIDGHWAADQVSIFHSHLMEKVKEDLDITVNILRNIDNKKVKSFWLFFLIVRIPKQMIFHF